MHFWFYKPFCILLYFIHNHSVVDHFCLFWNFLFSFLRAEDDQTRSFFNKGKDKRTKAPKNEILGGGDYQWKKSWRSFIFLPKLLTGFVYTFPKEIMAIRCQDKGGGRRRGPREDKFIRAVAKEDFALYCKDVLKQLSSTDMSHYSRFLEVNLL